MMQKIIKHIMKK